VTLLACRFSAPVAQPDFHPGPQLLRSCSSIVRFATATTAYPELLSLQSSSSRGKQLLATADPERSSSSIRVPSPAVSYSTALRSFRADGQQSPVLMLSPEDHDVIEIIRKASSRFCRLIFPNAFPNYFPTIFQKSLGNIVWGAFGGQRWITILQILLLSSNRSDVEVIDLSFIPVMYICI
jgi:hypothetical protein